MIRSSMRNANVSYIPSAKGALCGPVVRRELFAALQL